MATNLYDTLGLARDASQEHIRKAYRRKALDTHPDRLPPGASSSQKSAAEEQFRQVNAAYEVLSNPKTRQEYDVAGVWPSQNRAPDPGPMPSANAGGDPFMHPFFNDPFFGGRHDPFFNSAFGGGGGFPFGPGFPFGGPGATMGSRSRRSPGHDSFFTDPFELFNSMFGDFDHAFRDMSASPAHDEPFMGGPVSGFPFGGGRQPGNGNFTSFQQSTSYGGRGGGSSGRWVSESTSTRTVNGVTHTVHTRRDAEGNEHVTHTYPDGTKKRVVNGIEQPSSSSSRRHISAPPQTSAPPVPPVPHAPPVPPVAPAPPAIPPLPRSPISTGPPGPTPEQFDYYTNPYDGERDRRRHRSARDDYYNGRDRDYDRGHDDRSRHHHHHSHHGDHHRPRASADTNPSPVYSDPYYTSESSVSPSRPAAFSPHPADHADRDGAAASAAAAGHAGYRAGVGPAHADDRTEKRSSWKFWK
ncbi:DnaJ-domain-containing protein [Coniophora puteana RWD-64-598 SS2]|uniref:DnaJ-domain-containing protein n=1 Tax=Coniophora puteana (strain RWD-64-598) TaxID=741705 RepID=A0A5M3MKY3_CONPW|nr:DnaJ-domain-containing protein [Coniophora puteana RWD-64-598 SS2]EIW79221.1 DnaJ-domain-containing protein [Coniophora puteana RWD-64-598 SS2]